MSSSRMFLVLFVPVLYAISFPVCRAASGLAEHSKTSEEIIEEIDSRYPRPSIPMDQPSLSAVDFYPPAVVVLETGESMLVNGISCSNEGAELFRKIIVSDDTRLIKQVVTRENGVAVANIWMKIDFSDDGSQPSFGFSSPTETSITSNWCQPNGAEPRMLADRYRALDEAFNK